jgi:hypothetical protein
MKSSFRFFYLLFLILLLTCFTIPLLFSQSGSLRNNNSLTNDIICWWSFDNEIHQSVFDKAEQKSDSVYGNFEYVPGISGKAIKLDGFRTYIRKNPYIQKKPEGAFTVESWIALASYPWSWSPIIDCSSHNINGFFLGIDPEGHVGFKIAAGSSWYELKTEKKVSLREWALISAVFKPDEEISIFINGEEAASEKIVGNYIPVRSGTLTIGRNNSSQTWNEYQLTTKNSYFYLDGILDEIKLTYKAKTKDEIKSDFTSIVTLPVPALSNREKLPIGPKGKGSFGAFYTKLDYYKEWDDLWRVSDVSDLFVRFDESPVQLVFWRGTSYVPCWVTENGIWYTNEWLETWGSDVASCAEPLMDRQCRYSNVRLIENTDARIVIHWRYALADAFYNFAAVTDDGRGEWCDEFYIIYPDQVGIRKMDLHYSKPERKHDWEEQIVVLPPGKYPGDVIEDGEISLVNMQGEQKRYFWKDNIKVEMPEPKGANMSYVHLKSKYRPFFIISPNAVKTVEGNWDYPFFRTYAANMASSYRQDPVPTVYGWWNHWPVTQIPGDGRWVLTPDHPSHFNLTTFVQWEDYEHTERTRTRIMLQGMTNGNPIDLVPLAKSWLNAPKMKILSDGFKGGIYDKSERAYIIENADQGNKLPLRLEISASDDSPLQNPAIIIKNWGRKMATLSINGENILPGKDFRQGIRSTAFSEDLILWIKLEKVKPLNITLK